MPKTAQARVNWIRKELDSMAIDGTFNRLGYDRYREKQKELDRELSIAITMTRLACPCSRCARFRASAL